MPQVPKVLQDKPMLRKTLLGLTIVVAVLGLWVGLNIGFALMTLPNVHNLSQADVEPNKTTRIMAADGTVIMSYGKYAHYPVALSKISPTLKKTILATEDRRFYKHHGVDPKSVLRATFANMKAGGIREGASTISQQLARTIYLSNERSWMRKIKEAMIATRLENDLSKDEILSLYLNNVYFGEGAYGVEAASRVYFNRHADKLDAAQAATLAGLIQAPSSYDPYQNPNDGKKRRNEVLQIMAGQGIIPKATADKLATTNIKLSGLGNSDPDKAPFFNRYVIKEAMAQLRVNDEKEFWDRGYRIHTTLNPRAQYLATRQMSRIRSEGAMLSLDEQNRMIAYAGGRNFSRSQYDHITQARRPAGSLIKPLIYATAMRYDHTPRDVYYDEAICFETWCPRNYDRSHHGAMSLAQALVQSNNVIAVQVLNDVGPNRVIDQAHRMGLQGDIQPNLSLALGATDVNLAEMTAAYSVFRNNGLYIEPYGIEKITDIDGRELYQHTERSHQALDQQTRDTMVKMMQGVMLYGTGRGASLNRMAAGKTGTSDNYKDAWFVGFTPGVTTGVWMGNDNNRPMPGVTGGSLPASLWRGYMGDYLAGTPRQEFEVAYALPLDREDFFGPQRMDTMLVQAPVSGVQRVFRFITTEVASNSEGSQMEVKQHDPAREWLQHQFSQRVSEGRAAVQEDPGQGEPPPARAGRKGAKWKAIRREVRQTWDGIKTVVEDEEAETY